MLAEAGIEPLRDKGVALTEYAIELFDAWLAPLGFDAGQPAGRRACAAATSRCAIRRRSASAAR